MTLKLLVPNDYLLMIEVIYWSIWQVPSLSSASPDLVQNIYKFILTDLIKTLLYSIGHGGDEFLKFQDVEEISSHDLGDTFEQMHQKRRYISIRIISM